MMDISQNPFAVHNPDALDEVPAETIVELFIEDHTKTSAVKQKKHSFIWGSRGSGKSFMLRYLEPQCRFIDHGSPEAFFESSQPFIAIYTPCKKGEIDKSELDCLDDASSMVLSEHLLNLTIAEETISTIDNQFPDDYASNEQKIQLVQSIQDLFDSGAISGSVSSANQNSDVEEEPFEWLRRVFEEEKRRVTHYLQRAPFDDTKYTGATSGYHDFLLPMMSRVQEHLKVEHVPIYILLDDAFHLTEKQQRVINSWIANRDQGTLCVKVSSDRDRYETFQTTGVGKIETPHDFTQIDIDEIYTRDTGQYAKKVRKIANKRLEVSDVPAECIEDLLPKNEFEQELLEEIKASLEEEWEQEGRPQDLSDYKSRYAKARLFQELKSRRNQKSYAGFENLVHISSGRIRNFLDPCYLMFEEKKRQGKEPEEIEEIPPRTQDRVLREYSRDFLIEHPDTIRKDLAPEERTHLDKLTTLINSLGQLFYERLHDPHSREPRVFSFTINEEISAESELQKILNLGRKEDYLKKSTYSSKDGGGRVDWYLLNRRLAPQFKIDPTGFQGRLSLRPEQLEIGCEDPDRFVREVRNSDESQTSLNKFEGE